MRGEAKSLSWFWRIIWRHFKCAAQQGMRFKGWQSIWPFLFVALEKPSENFDKKTASPCTSLL